MVVLVAATGLVVGGCVTSLGISVERIESRDRVIFNAALHNGGLLAIHSVEQPCVIDSVPRRSRICDTSDQPRYIVRAIDRRGPRIVRLRTAHFVREYSEPRFKSFGVSTTTSAVGGILANMVIAKLMLLGSANNKKESVSYANRWGMPVIFKTERYVYRLVIFVEGGEKSATP